MQLLTFLGSIAAFKYSDSCITHGVISVSRRCRLCWRRRRRREEPRNGTEKLSMMDASTTHTALPEDSMEPHNTDAVWKVWGRESRGCLHVRDFVLNATAAALCLTVMAVCYGRALCAQRRDISGWGLCSIKQQHRSFHPPLKGQPCLRLWWSFRTKRTPFWIYNKHKSEMSFLLVVCRHGHFFFFQMAWSHIRLWPFHLALLTAQR